MAGADDETRMKGINFLGTLAAVERLEGAEARARVLESVSQPVGDELKRNLLLASAWYPVSWYAALLEAMVEVLEDEDAPRRMARSAVAEDVRTLFRLMTLVIAPETAVRQGTRFMMRYYSDGEIDLRRFEADGVEFGVTGVRGFDARVWRDFCGGTEGLFDASGYVDVSTAVVRGGGDGDGAATIRIRWATSRRRGLPRLFARRSLGGDEPRHEP